METIPQIKLLSHEKKLKRPNKSNSCEGKDDSMMYADVLRDNLKKQGYFIDIIDNADINELKVYNYENLTDC